MTCKQCGSETGLCLSWQTFRNDTRHIRVDCNDCGCFSHYEPQTPQAVAMADAEAQYQRDIRCRMHPENGK